MKIWFTCNNPNWVNNGDANCMFLMHMQNYLNDKLRINGYLTVADILSNIGIDPLTYARTKKINVFNLIFVTPACTFVDLGVKIRNVRKAKKRVALNINFEDAIANGGLKGLI